MSAGAGAALRALYDLARQGGRFERAKIGEYKKPPGAKLSFSVRADRFGAGQDGSGLAVTGALLRAQARILAPLTFDNSDDLLEVAMLDAADDYLGRVSGGFTLSGAVRNVDLLGETGDPPEWIFGYVMIDQAMYRIADIELRMIINDAWEQAA